MDVAPVGSNNPTITPEMMDFMFQNRGNLMLVFPSSLLPEGAYINV
jgi:hypothetical protein